MTSSAVEQYMGGGSVRWQEKSHYFGYFLSFFFNDPASTEIYTLSLHDALPISARLSRRPCRRDRGDLPYGRDLGDHLTRDRKSTRLNSSHPSISYAVSCLKKKTTLHCFDLLQASSRSGNLCKRFCFCH